MLFFLFLLLYAGFVFADVPLHDRDHDCHHEVFAAFALRALPVADKVKDVLQQPAGFFHCQHVNRVTPVGIDLEPFHQ